MGDAANKRVDDTWYGTSFLSTLLLPLSWLFGAAAAIRRGAYARDWRRRITVDAPVVIVGNIAVGGTGKTPLTIWLADALKQRGLEPGVISRGYGGSVGPEPVHVTPESDPAVVGDEAILLADRCDGPVVVHPDRVAAAKKAIALGANVVVADDGLQHYRLARNYEIAVVDSGRGFGNGRLLPAGPLREPLSRLNSINDVVLHRTTENQPEVLRRASDRRPVEFSLLINAAARLDRSEVVPIDNFRGKTVHAVAGIGHPERFFHALESRGIKLIRHPLQDHATIEPSDINFDDDLDVLMTEKDAVKCRWLDTAQCWYVPADVVFEDGDDERLLHRLEDAIR